MSPAFLHAAAAAAASVCAVTAATAARQGGGKVQEESWHARHLASPPFVAALQDSGRAKRAEQKQNPSTAPAPTRSIRRVAWGTSCARRAWERGRGRTSAVRLQLGRDGAESSAPGYSSGPAAALKDRKSAPCTRRGELPFKLRELCGLNNRPLSLWGAVQRLETTLWRVERDAAFGPRAVFPLATESALM